VKQPPLAAPRYAALLASGLLAGALTLSGGAAPALAAGTSPSYAVPSTTHVGAKPAAKRDGLLDSHDAELLANAELTHQKTVDLIVMAATGKTEQVAQAVRKLSGLVGASSAKLGYLHVQVPTGKVHAVAQLATVTNLDLNETFKLDDPVADDQGNANRTSPETPGATTKADNPFMPTGETNANAFKKAHPTWDGRGITIGVLDSGAAVDHPALAKTSTGDRKIVDWFTATNPVLEGPLAPGGDNSWLQMKTDVAGPQFTQGGVNYTAPAGAFKFALFKEIATDGEENGGDVNRDGDKTDVFGVLYDAKSGDIRVDSDADGDFTNNEVMRPYKEKFQIGYFGKDKPETDVQERMPFTVEYRKDLVYNTAGAKADFVSIGLTAGEHGTHVAGITAANDMFGNPVFDGNAPGARIVSGRACTFGGGCTSSALTDGLVDMVENRKVDVVNISIGGLSPLNGGADSRDARAALYDRIISVFGVQLFISAGNSGPGVNTIGSPSHYDKVVSVAASISKNTWLYNYGSVVRSTNAIFPYSSRGPREDGGFKPNISAPGSAIASTPAWMAGGPAVEAGYPLPAGYSMLQGTSMASPQATGAAALLLSAARATGAGITPAALRRAIYTSATPIKGVPTYIQGNGMFNVTGAWNLLAKSPLETREYKADAPVCTPLSGMFDTPNHGAGVYNRCPAASGGQKVNEARTYVVQLTRTSGKAGAFVHNLAFVGNDGTFSAPKTVTLEKNKPVSIKVVAKPTSFGMHSAVLRVDDPKTPVVDFELSTAVIVAEELTAPNFGADYEDAIERNNTRSYFLNVPAGASALKVNMSDIATGSQVRWLAIDPTGMPIENNSTRNCYPNYSDPKVCNPRTRTYANPMPGIWELEVEARRTSPAMDNPYRMTAAVMGVKLAPATVVIPSIPVGKDGLATWKLTNNFGPVSLSAKAGALGSIATKSESIKNKEQKTYTVEVPAGAQRLAIAIGNPSDKLADLDLSVKLGDKVVGSSGTSGSNESVTLENPEAGTYTVIIDGYSVISGNTTFDYMDAFFAPSLGALSVRMSPSAGTVPAGGAATVIGGVNPKAIPAAGRSLVGQVNVVDADGAIVGSGTVLVTTVTAR